nr:hypothetical protein [Tanacetum cinerariifolium]
FTTLRVNSPSFSGRIVPFFDTMLVHQGEGSDTPTEPHHTPSPEADTSHPTTSSIPVPSLPTDPIPLVSQTNTTPISMQQTISELTALCTSLQRQHSELLVKFQAQEEEIVRSNETIAKYLQEYQDFASELPLEKRIELISDLVKYQENYSKVEDFIPMGSKEEAERLKRKGLNLEQEHVKKQKSSEEAPEIEKSTEEITEEKIKEMMQLVPVEDVYVQAFQVKHPIIDWKVGLKRLYEPDPEDQLWAQTQNYMHAPTKWKLYDLSRVHHVTAKDREIFMLVEKDYPLRKGLALVMISYKLQVDNYSQMVEDLIRKIYNIANTPRQQGD